VLEPVDEFVQELGLRPRVMVEVLRFVEVDLLAKRIPPEDATAAIAELSRLFLKNALGNEVDGRERLRNRVLSQRLGEAQ